MDKIKAIIEANIEDTDRADRILSAIKKFDGKLLSEPIAKKIGEESGETKVYIRRQHGMTHLEFGGYGMTNDPDQGVSLLLAHQEKNVHIDAADIEKRNTAYYSAAKERNAKRREALADEPEMLALQSAIDAVNLALEQYNRLTAYGTPMAHDESSIRRLFNKKNIPDFRHI